MSVYGDRTMERNANWRGGKSYHPLCDIYWQMIGRCHTPTHRRYADYGGRGISVCQRWRDDFWAFVADIGERPPERLPSGRPAYTLDRVDNDGDYCPENVRWATWAEQARNSRPQRRTPQRDLMTGQFVRD